MTSQPDVLDEIGQLYMTELDKLPLSELSRMTRQVTAIKEAATIYHGSLQNALHNRLGEQAQCLGGARGDHRVAVQQRAVQVEYNEFHGEGPFSFVMHRV
jgi:hypothetical protein